MTKKQTASAVADRLAGKSQLLLRANTSNESCVPLRHPSWDADYLLATLTPETEKKLKAQQLKSARFLKANGGASYGHVELECEFPVSAGRCDLSDEDEDEMDTAEFIKVADDFAFTDPARIDCITVRFYASGSIYLRALAKDSSDYAEAPLPI